LSNKLAEIAEDSARGGFFLFTRNVLFLFTLALVSIITARLLEPASFYRHEKALRRKPRDIRHYEQP